MRRFPILALILMASFSLAGCEVVEAIFKAGVWVGVILLLFVILVIWLISRLFR